MLYFQTNCIDSSSGASTKNWSSMLAAAGTDDKSISKFKRLMGIRDETEKTTIECDNEKALVAERERQANLYRGLDQQYEMARSATHCGRGKGLGFGSI
jgi:hypothetical protein